MSDVSRPGSAVMIAHALGAVDGVTYTNSEAAFRASMESGFRVLEADLSVCADGKIVLYHHKKPEHESEVGWRDRKAHQLSWATLSNKRYMDRYPVLDIEGFVELVREYPDIKVVLDIKSVNKSRVLFARKDSEIGLLNSLLVRYHEKRKTDFGPLASWVLRLFGWSSTSRMNPHREIVEKLVSIADKALLRRLIPQVGKDSVRQIEAVHHFPLKIWKPSGESIETAFMLARENECRYISLRESSVSGREIELGRQHDVKILVWGAESQDRIDELLDEGVAGFYLDHYGDFAPAAI